MTFTANYIVYECGVKWTTEIPQVLPGNDYDTANAVAHKIEELYNKEHYDTQIYLVGVTVTGWKYKDLKGGGNVCNI